MDAERRAHFAQKVVNVLTENHGLPTQDREDLADIALEEVVQSNTTSEEDDENEFAEFVFAAAFDDNIVNTELEQLELLQ